MYKAAGNRYEVMEYKRSGRSGVLLPRISLGLWQNFGLEKSLEEQKDILFRAFDMGITHFDLLIITATLPGEWRKKILEPSLNRILEDTEMNCSFPPKRDMTSGRGPMETGVPGNT